MSYVHFVNNMYDKKGEMTLQFLKISFIIILTVYIVLLLFFCYKNGKFLKTLLLSALSGLIVLTAINLLSGVTGVGISINGWTVGTSALFGMPGVLGLLTIRMFF